jgi:hypothetical protein
MNKKTSLLLCALLLGATASPSAIAGTMVLDSFAEETGPIDEAVDKVLMATVNTSGQQGGNDASDTTVSIGGSVLAADIGEVCVNYGGVEISCQVNPGSTTNIVLTLPGNQKGGSPFTYHVTLNTSAAGKDITLTVEAIGNTNLTDNIGLPRTTTPRTVFSSAGVAPTVDTPTSGTPTYDNPTWSADLGGTVSDAGTPSTLSSCGVDWGTAPADPPTTPYPNSVPGGVPCSGTGDAFTVNVSGLPSSATIYFRPWADNGLRGYSTTEGPTTVMRPLPNEASTGATGRRVPRTVPRFRWHWGPGPASTSRRSMDCPPERTSITARMPSTRSERRWARSPRSRSQHWRVSPR